jgi:hypothetical protein
VGVEPVSEVSATPTPSAAPPSLPTRGREGLARIHGLGDQRGWFSEGVDTRASAGMTMGVYSPHLIPVMLAEGEHHPPPPCGEGLGVGVAPISEVSATPTPSAAPPSLPTRGREGLARIHGFRRSTRVVQQAVDCMFIVIVQEVDGSNGSGDRAWEGLAARGHGPARIERTEFIRALHEDERGDGRRSV